VGVTTTIGGEGGLQAERTALAHVRTDLLVAGVAVLLIRLAGHGAERIVVGMITAAAAVTCTTLGVRRRRRLRADHPPPERWAHAVIAASAGALQLAGLLVVI
jgi:uncharacterized membrane protein YidH (DUF202 family)